jgi:hypothetical protein
MGVAYAKPVADNTLDLLSQPAYGEDAVFAVTVARHYNGDLKLATWCSDVDSYTGAESAPIPRWKGKTWQGTMTRIMAHPTWQPPMLCCTGLFWDPSSVKKPEQYVSNSVCYTIGAESDG